MRKIKIEQVLAIFFLMAVLPLRAIEFVSTNEYLVGADETVSSEQWISSLDAQVAGTAKDDFFLLAQTRAELNGDFSENLWAMANAVEFGGTVQRNARFLARSLGVDGRIDGSVMALGDTLNFSTNAVVKGDVRVLGNKVVLEGSYAGEVTVVASQIATISAEIKGDLHVTAPEIVLQRSARIDGDLIYTSSKELIPDEGAVGGELRRITPVTPNPFSLQQFQMRFLGFISALLVGIPFLSLFPTSLMVGTALLRQSFLKCLWVGMLAIFILPLLGMMAVASMVGVPLGAFLLGTWGALIFLSRIVVALVVGAFLLRRPSVSFGGALLALTCGLGLLYFVFMLPSVGWGLQILVACSGAGALLLGAFSRQRMASVLLSSQQGSSAMKAEQNQKEKEL